MWILDQQDRGNSIWALRSASASRIGSELNTTHVKVGGCGASASLRIVPPQPISRSSQWAPRQSTLRMCGVRCSKRSDSMRARSTDTHRARARHAFARRAPKVTVAPVELPHLPANLTTRVQVLEQLFVLERVHASPEAVVGIGEQPARSGEPLKWLLDQFLAGFHPVKNLRPHHEEATVDPHS